MGEALTMQSESQSDLIDACKAALEKAEYARSSGVTGIDTEVAQVQAWLLQLEALAALGDASSIESCDHALKLAKEALAAGTQAEVKHERMEAEIARVEKVRKEFTGAIETLARAETISQIETALADPLIKGKKSDKGQIGQAISAAQGRLDKS